MRLAWVGAAAEQIESILRYSVNCLKANRQEAQNKRRLRRRVLKCAGACLAHASWKSCR